MKINPNKLRKHVLDMVYLKQSGHIGGSFSICELIAYLYSNYDLINKDKIILSKGHAVPALYAVLYELGYIKDFNLFREIDSPLQGHPDKLRLKYMHATTGSLGQGLSISIGHALAFKMKKSKNKVFCILGDGELQEGQIWEGLMLAPKYKLDNLFCFIDYNKYQSDTTIKDTVNIESLYEKIKSFNWNVITIDGHSENEINEVFNKIKPSVPTCIIMNTIKGKGVSFMQSKEWHAKAPNQLEYEQALKELNYE